MSFTRSLIFYGAGAVTHEHERACKNVEDCRQLRKKYFGSGASKIQLDALKGDLTFRWGEDGVMELYDVKDKECKHNLSVVPDVEEFSKDYS
jgi:hypothetical protein